MATSQYAGACQEAGQEVIAMIQKPRLIVDGQIFQTPAWDRGMGKYSVELLSALDSLNKQKEGWAEIEIILSSKIKFQKEVLKEINQRITDVRVTFLNLESNHYNNITVARKNRRVVDKYINKTRAGKIKQHIDFLILSLMQSEIAPVFPSTDNIQKLLLIYDLIPLMLFETYLTDKTHRMVYLSKLAELMRADRYLTISETVANDLANQVGISGHRIDNINGGPISHSENYEPFDVPKPFILMPTGNDLRKNNRRGVEGFHLFNQENKRKYYLVITSNFEKFQIDELNNISDKLIFTGNVSGSQLNYLYRESDALLFPAEYEGLGLPILESLEQAKPVICSDISVFREISKTAFTFFDPLNPTSIASALNTGLSKEPLVNKEAYERILKKYTWLNTARSLYEISNRAGIATADKKNTKLAIFCADPAFSQSGQAQQRLYAELQRQTRVEYYVEMQHTGRPLSVSYVPFVTPAYDLTKRVDIDLRKYKELIFSLEDTDKCGIILLAALGNQGVLMLKSTDLTNLWQSALDHRLIDRTRYEAEMRLNKLYDKTDTAFLASLVDRRKLIIVTSAANKVKVESLAKLLGSTTRVVNLGEPKPDVVYAVTRQEHFGIEEYIDQLMDALKHQRKET